MIQENYVSFETAKLLKEKGFPEGYQHTNYFMDENGNQATCTIFGDIGKNITTIPRPTLQMAMAWLREVHKLYVVVRPYVTEEEFFSLFDVKSVKEKGTVVNLRTKTGFTTYEEACEAAIKYCLEKLI